MKYVKYSFISKIFYKIRAEDDIENIKILKTIIEDITALRFDKINKHIENNKSIHLTMNLNNICARELEQVRPFVTEIFAMKLETFNCK